MKLLTVLALGVLLAAPLHAQDDMPEDDFDVVPQSDYGYRPSKHHQQDPEDQDIDNQDTGDQDINDQDTGDQDTDDQDTGDQDIGDQDTGDQDIDDEDTGDQINSQQQDETTTIKNQSNGKNVEFTPRLGRDTQLVTGDQNIGDQGKVDQGEYPLEAPAEEYLLFGLHPRF